MLEGNDVHRRGSQAMQHDDGIPGIYLQGRASDADREHVAQLLNDARLAGRLTPCEHVERLESAFDACTLGQLAALICDLCPAQSAVPASEPERAVLTLTVIGGKDVRGGAWLVPSLFRIVAVRGTVQLDLRRARLQARTTIVIIDALWSAVTLLVPDSITVVDQSKALFGSTCGQQEAGLQAPRVVLRGRRLGGSLHIARRQPFVWNVLNGVPIAPHIRSHA